MNGRSKQREWSALKDEALYAQYSVTVDNRSMVLMADFPEDELQSAETLYTMFTEAHEATANNFYQRSRRRTSELRSTQMKSDRR